MHTYNRHTTYLSVLEKLQAIGALVQLISKSREGTLDDTTHINALGSLEVKLDRTAQLLRVLGSELGQE
jgi:hypothetical protein